MIMVPAPCTQARHGVAGGGGGVGGVGTGTQLQVSTHPIGVKQSLAFSFSTKREVTFPGFLTSAMDMDSTLRRRRRR